MNPVLLILSTNVSLRNLWSLFSESITHSNCVWDKQKLSLDFTQDKRKLELESVAGELEEQELLELSMEKKEEESKLQKLARLCQHGVIGSLERKLLSFYVVCLADQLLQRIF